MNNSQTYTFPKGFEWGTATSAFQIEGGGKQDGRGPSVWDTFCEQPDRIRDASTGLVACDHYNRYKEDVALLKSLGIQTYRFSLSWSRIFPNGDSELNEAGAAFYDRLVDELLAAGINPAVTLFHWDLPQALEDKFGGWTSRETSKRLGDFAEWVGKRLGDRVDRFFTINEFFNFTERCYGIGHFAPGRVESRKVMNQTCHNGLLGHGYALAGLRASAPKAQVGLVENIKPFIPVFESEENILAASKAFREENGRYITPIMEGAYPDSYLEAEGEDAPTVEAGDFDIISAPTDFLGMNIYTGDYVTHSDEPKGYEIIKFHETYPSMSEPWIRIVPDSLYWAPRFSAEHWGDRPMYIAESGCSARDFIDEKGRVMDIERVLYLRQYLKGLHRATSEGYPVKGYYLWSMMDNFEWCDGYDTRFGMVYVDFDTLERTPKLSAKFYSETISQNRIV
ncbi:GH1 family beta-glucosidase [Pelagicoccus mobilis]|uniref:Beta-glucosidase n=1 Tax=Pelagicoccus mobilis TaxID=415221 RepID=A0A934S3J4_9BACT|nr:GH1 family beta-glucosidase [Pelagicoccus mobilis]MBK1880439.1 beta-glucosidase [Pelagicoccus mobilis]